MMLPAITLWCLHHFSCSGFRGAHCHTELIIVHHHRCCAAAGLARPHSSSSCASHVNKGFQVFQLASHEVLLDTLLCFHSSLVTRAQRYMTFTKLGALHMSSAKCAMPHVCCTHMHQIRYHVFDAIWMIPHVWCYMVDAK